MMTISKKSGIIYVIKAMVLVIGLYITIYLYRLNAPNLGRPVSWDCSTSDSNYDGFNKTQVLVGIFTTKEKLTRRNMIRQTYLQYKPRDMIYKFVAVATEEEMQEENDLYGDILVLNMEKENMNDGKTFEYFRTVASKFEVDFVLKADDDAYLHLDRIYYDLSHTDRTRTYWGYLVGNTFMAGQCYGLSMDLVHWVSNSRLAEQYKGGHEDSQVQKWFRWSGIDHGVQYEVRNCKIHDYVHSETVYAKEIDLNNTMIVHYLKKDHFFMDTHYTLSQTYHN